MKESLGYKMMLAFEGETAPERILQWVKDRPVAGFTLFRHLNVQNPAQVRGLVEELQMAVAQAGRPPLIIAADQEGGQLMALGSDTTPFPGNMALAAAGDAQLTRRVGQALGREMAAMGLNVNYAPVCDLNSNPANPATGVRTFGDDPVLAAEMAGAMVAGLQSAGVGATMKHFPGSGEAKVDSHYQMPVIDLSRERLDQREFRPFQAAIKAGVKLAMSGHFAIPSLTGSEEIPATLSRAVMHDLLRNELGFAGLVISDALDMGAITQGAGQVIDVIAAVRAEVDLLLLTAKADVQDRLYSGLHLAYARGLIEAGHLQNSIKRIFAFKEWAGSQVQPELDVVGCAAHHKLAQEAAGRAITLVRDEGGLLPLHLAGEARIAVIMPQPQNLTPADTSAFVTPLPATAVRAYHPHVDEFITQFAPTEEEIAALLSKVNQYDLLLVGTISAAMEPAQALLVNELLQMDVPLITIALRTPYDLTAYPQAKTTICTYSILEPSMQALAAALWGHIPISGRLPVSIGNLYPFGHGLFH